MFLERFKMFQGKITDILKLASDDPLDFFQCNSSWPVCAFNYTKQYVIPEIFTFKVFESFNESLIQTYFTLDKLSIAPKESLR